MQRTERPAPLRPLSMGAPPLVNLRKRELEPLTALVQWWPEIPTRLIEPLLLSWMPAMVNFSGEAKAPVLVLLTQLKRSDTNSGSVGILYPLGQGLFTPFTPCHRLSFCGLLQSNGALGARIKIPFAGWSILLKVDVVADVRHWCPSLPRPHWYKSP